MALDTGVIIEYIDKKGKYHKPAETLFNTLLKGKLEAIIPHPVLTEVHYVIYRIYKAIGLRNAEERATKLVRWLYYLPTVEVKGEDLSLALEAARVKLKYGIALTDCYVIASARIYNGKAVFRKREKEMLEKIDEIVKEYPVVFLEDYLA